MQSPLYQDVEFQKIDDLTNYFIQADQLLRDFGINEERKNELSEKIIKIILEVLEEINKLPEEQLTKENWEYIDKKGTVKLNFLNTYLNEPR